MSEPTQRHASPRWSAVVDHLNSVQRRRQAAARPVAEIADALRADPVGVFLQDHGVAWIRWQDPVSDANRISALLRFANNLPDAKPDALNLSTPQAIDREVWRSRLRRIAAADNNAERAKLQRSLAPELVSEIRDNAVFVVDHKIISELRFRMLERYGSIASLSYATLLLLAPDGPGKKLCECQLAGCGVFYFAPPGEGPGRKKTRYCTQEHLDAGQRQLNSERVRRFKRKPK